MAEDYYYNSTYAFAENKLGMGIELEGAEIHTWLQQKMVGDAVQNPNGVGAHTIGVFQGLANTATDIADAVYNPVQTLKGAGNAALWLAVGSQFSEQVDGALGTNSTGAGDAILNSVVQGGDNLINGNGIERGTTIGEIVGAAAGTKGANAAIKSISITNKAVNTLSKIDRIVPDIPEGGIKRIQNAANRINSEIHLVGSRAKGTAKATSDFDYIIPSINSKQWSKIKSSLPGAKSTIDNLPNRIDRLKVPLDKNLPYITIKPIN